MGNYFDVGSGKIEGHNGKHPPNGRVPLDWKRSILYIHLFPYFFNNTFSTS